MLLANVVSALLRDDVPPMPLTGVNEAAVGVLFEHIRQSIHFEVDGQREFPDEPLLFWRRAVLALVGREGWPEDEPLPPVTCVDVKEWEWMVESLADAILWDGDWLDEKLYMDVDPDTAAMQKQRMGIDEDYYTAIVPQPTAGDIEKARQTLIEFMAQEHDQ